MKRKKSSDNEEASLDKLIAEITVDTHSVPEKVSAFLQVFKDNISVPRDAFLHGEPVLVLGFAIEGRKHPRIEAWCSGKNHSQYAVAATDLVLPPRSKAARYVAAYRRWLGLKPLSTEDAARLYRAQKEAAAPISLDPEALVELVVLSASDKGANCRVLGTNREMTLRTERHWALVPGEIVVVKPIKQWMYARRSHVSGDIVSTRLDASALGLVPLHLEAVGDWGPQEEYWGDDDEPPRDAVEVIAEGSRLMFEMEQVVPGAHYQDPVYDPIAAAIEFVEEGFDPVAFEILMGLCESDLRCLDAHAHIGSLVFEEFPEQAIRHFEVGVRIGELSLGADFKGVLPWVILDNRPFLRCAHGYGLCLWRLGRIEEAVRVFDWMVWLNPMDNQGARFLIDDIRSGRTWEECEEEE